MRLSIIACSIIDDAKVAKRVRDKMSVTSMPMVHKYLRSFFLGVFFWFASKREQGPARAGYSSPITANMQFV